MPVNFGSSPAQQVSWATLKGLVASKSLALQCDSDDPTCYVLFAFDGALAYYTTLFVTDPQGVPNYDSAQNAADRGDYEANYQPHVNRSLTPRTPDSKPFAVLWPTEGTKKTIISPNWCDRTTWFGNATRVADEVATAANAPAYTQYDLAHSPLIDTYHGKISGEDFLKDAGGNSYRVVVKVNGATKTEQDPHTASGGDYTIDYVTGRVTFLASLAATDEVRVTYYYADGSAFLIKPEAGKRLKIRRAEVQFSKDIDIKDTVRFQPYGYVVVFAPSLAQSNGGPYPDQTLIPLGDPVVYKTMMDYINEANGAMPTIPQLNLVPSWRNLLQEIITFPWDYQSMTELISSYGMEVRVSLEHDLAFGGLVATATFYCLVVDE